MLDFKDKKIMLDCGIHPGFYGKGALPNFDDIEDVRQVAKSKPIVFCEKN